MSSDVNKLSEIKQPMKEKLAYHPLLLGGIALIAGAMLVFADIATRSAIAERQAEDLRASLTQVVPDDIHDNNLLEDTVTLHAPLEFADHEAGIIFYRARLKGKAVAAAFQVIGMGYSGAINIIMSVDRSGAILGVRVVSHAETPGLGDKIEAAKSDWIKHFSGLSLANRNARQWAVKKDGGEFDQFSGATITPRAVVRAVHKGLQYFNEHRDEILGEKPVAHDNGGVARCSLPKHIDSYASVAALRAPCPSRALDGFPQSILNLESDHG